MAFFDRFRKKSPESPKDFPITLPQLAYDVAYFVLPLYAHKQPQKIIDLCTTQPRAAGPFFYVMACVQRKVEPVKADAERFSWHHGDLDAQRRYYALEFPPPPPVDLSDLPPEAIMEARVVLAPYFAAVLLDHASNPLGYYILGQAPLGGGTTLRSVTLEVNANLGPGPAPRLELFLERLRQLDEKIQRPDRAAR
jgi:hypothetical protein